MTELGSNYLSCERASEREGEEQAGCTRQKRRRKAEDQRIDHSHLEGSRDKRGQIGLKGDEIWENKYWGKRRKGGYVSSPGHGGQPMAAERRVRLARRLGPEAKSKSMLGSLKPIHSVLAWWRARSRRGRLGGAQSPALNCTLQFMRTSSKPPIGPIPNITSSHPPHAINDTSGRRQGTEATPKQLLRPAAVLMYCNLPEPLPARCPPATRRRERRMAAGTYLKPPRSPVGSKDLMHLDAGEIRALSAIVLHAPLPSRPDPSGRAPTSLKLLTDVRSGSRFASNS
jgi:hypothetical protein